MSAEKKFKIRSPKLLEEGYFSEEEVIEKIEAQVLDANDEFSLLPFKKWYPLSSYPSFYDVLVKKLFKSKYKDKKKKTKVEPPAITQNKSIFTQDVRDLKKDLGENPPVSEKTHQVNLSELEGVEDLFTNGLEEVDLSLERNEENPPSMDPLSKPIPELTPSPPQKSKRLKVILLAVASLALVVFLLPESKKESLKAPKAPAPSEALSADTKERVKLLVQEANQLFQNGTLPFFRGAYEVYFQALGLDPSHVGALGGLAESKVYSMETLSNTESEEIKKWIQQGRAREPLNSQFYRVEAILSAKQEYWKEAEEKLSLAIETDPSGIETAQAKAYIEWKQGKNKSLEEVLSPLSQSKQWNPFIKYLWLKSEFEKANYTTVKEEGIKLLQVNPLHAPTLLLLAKLAQRESRISEAKKMYEMALSLNAFCDKASLAEGLFEFSQLQSTLGEKKLSEENLRTALYLNPKLKSREEIKKASQKEVEDYLSSKTFPSEYFVEKAEEAERSNNFKYSLIYLQGGYFLYPQNTGLLLKIAQLSEKLIDSFEDLKIVKNLYQRVLEKDPKQIKAYFALGLMELDQFNFEKAFTLLKKAEAVDPNDPQVYVALGKYYFKARDFNRAQLEFEKAFQLDNSNSEVLYYAGLLRLTLKQGADKVATELFFRAFAKNPTNYDALIEWLKLKVKNYEKGFALKFIKTLQQKEPKNPYYMWAIGEVYAQNNEARRAIDFFHKALDLDNHLSKVRFSLGRSLEAVGELDKAASEYRLASYLERRNGEGFFRAAELFFQIKNYKEAEEILKYLVERYPNYPGAHQYLSRIFKLKQNKEEAIAEMKKEITNNPSNPKFRLELSETLMGYQKWEDALKELTEMSNNPLFVKGPEFTMDRVRSYLLMSRCYRAIDKFENAEGAIRLALEVDANDPELQKELGYIYHELQRDKEAVGAFQNYLNRNPAARDAESIKSLIQRLQIE